MRHTPGCVTIAAAAGALPARAPGARDMRTRRPGIRRTGAAVLGVLAAMVLRLEPSAAPFRACRPSIGITRWCPR